MEKYLNMIFRNLRALEEIRRTRVSRIKCDQFKWIPKTESLAELNRDGIKLRQTIRGIEKFSHWKSWYKTTMLQKLYWQYKESSGVEERMSVYEERMESQQKRQMLFLEIMDGRRFHLEFAEGSATWHA